MKKRSIGRLLIQLVLLITLPLILISQLGLWQSFIHSNELLAQSNHLLLGSWIEKIDQRLDLISKQMYSFTYGSRELADFSAQEDGLGYTLSLVAVNNSLDSLLNNLMEVDAILINHKGSGQNAERFRETGYSSYSKRQEIRRFVSQYAANTKENSRTWALYNIGDNPYLVQVYERTGIRLLCFIRLDSLQLPKQDPFDTSFVTHSGQALTNVGFVNEHKITPPPKDRPYALSGRYMVLWENLENAPVKLLLFASNSSFWDRLTPFQIILLVLSLLLVFWPLLGHRLLKRYILSPLSSLSGAMEQTEEDSPPKQVRDEYEVIELDNLRLRYNEMTQRIASLKIQSYEKELERQQIELAYLHIQIKPHFYLNCLKGVSASLQAGYTQEASEMILAISRHLRFIFSKSNKLVSVADELEHTRNYIRMRQMSMAQPMLVTEKIDKEMEGASVLPFSIQTFVENAVKHRYIEGRQLQLHIQAKTLQTQEGRFANVLVRNNGGGFSPQTLAVVNSPQIDIYNKSHVGLNNIRARLRLMYGEEAMLAFYNEGDEAVVDMLWPFQTIQEKENAS